MEKSGKKRKLFQFHAHSLIRFTIKVAAHLLKLFRLKGERISKTFVLVKILTNIFSHFNLVILMHRTNALNEKKCQTNQKLSMTNVGNSLVFCSLELEPQKRFRDSNVRNLDFAPHFCSILYHLENKNDRSYNPYTLYSSSRGLQ